MKNNQPAFPQCTKSYATQYGGGNTDVVEKIQGGMSLRDYFAAKAMQGMLSSVSNGFELASNIVELSYEFADAMLEARKK